MLRQLLAVAQCISLHNKNNKVIHGNETGMRTSVYQNTPYNTKAEVISLAVLKLGKLLGNTP